MKVLLAVPPYRSVGIDAITGAVAPPTGLAQIAAYLNSHGLETVLLDAAALNLSWAAFEREVRRSGADIVGIGAITPLADQALRAAALAKKVLPEAVTVAGGPHFSYLFDEALEGGFDYVVRFEGEETMLSLVECLAAGTDPGLVAGIAFRRGDQTVVTAARPPVVDLDLLPWPDWQTLPFDKYHWWFRSPANVFLQTSRGCDKACTFCAIPAYWGGWRAVSADRVFAEVKKIYETYRVTVFYFGDDDFCGDVDRVRRFVDLLREADLPIRWFFQTRADTVVREAALIRAAAAAGAFMVLIGAEACTQTGLDKINKGFDVATVAKAIDILHDAGYLVWASYTFSPADGLAGLPELVRFAAARNTAVASFAPIAPYPGTAAWTKSPPAPEMYPDLDMYNVPSGLVETGTRNVAWAVFRAYLGYYARASYWRRYIFARDRVTRKIARRLVARGLAVAIVRHARSSRSGNMVKS